MFYLTKEADLVSQIFNISNWRWRLTNSAETPEKCSPTSNKRSELHVTSQNSVISKLNNKFNVLQGKTQEIKACGLQKMKTNLQVFQNALKVSADFSATVFDCRNTKMKFHLIKTCISKILTQIVQNFGRNARIWTQESTKCSSLHLFRFTNHPGVLHIEFRAP